MKIIKRLPGVFQTEPNKAFFDSTYEQFFAKKDTRPTPGFVGRKLAGSYNYRTDFYLDEPTNFRYNYQLEPVFVTKNDNSVSDTDVLFFEDFLKRLKEYGARVENLDKLLNSDTFSFAPPIDYDKFINYYNYYWLTDTKPVLVAGDDSFVESIIFDGLNTRVTLDGVIFQTIDGIEFDPRNGLKVQFPQSSKYNKEFYIEGIGRQVRLVVNIENENLKEHSAIRWDEYLTGFDEMSWDGIEIPTSKDYLTIERGASDFNDWSRNNYWFSKNVVDQMLALGSITVEDLKNAQAARPIIEFVRDMELYGFSIKFTGDVKLATHEPFWKFFGQERTGLYQYGLFEGDCLIFLEPQSIPDMWDNPDPEFVWDNFSDLWDSGFEDDITSFVWRVKYSDYGRSYLVPIYYDFAQNVYEDEVYPYTCQVQEDTHVHVTYGEYENKSFKKVSTGWQLLDKQIKTKVNQHPLFEMYDYQGRKLSDENIFPGTSFRGCKLFSYKENLYSPIIDKNLGFALTYRNQETMSEVVFENNFEDAEYSYYGTENETKIEGYYFYRKVLVAPDFEILDFDFDTCWVASTLRKNLRFVDRYVLYSNTIQEIKDANDKYSFFLGVEPIYSNNEYLIDVKVDSIKISSDRLSVTVDDYGYYVVEVDFSGITLKDNSFVEFYTNTDKEPFPGARGYFELPSSLENNPSNEEITDVTISDVYLHFTSTIKNQREIDEKISNYSETQKDLSKGAHILQNNDSMLKAMMGVVNTNTNLISSMRFASAEYSRFKNKFLKFTKTLINSGVVTDSSDIEQDIVNVMQMYFSSKEHGEAFGDVSPFAMGSGLDLLKNTSYTVDAQTADYEISLDINLNDVTDALYIRRNGELLLDGLDYTLEIYAGLVVAHVYNVDAGDLINIRFYKEIIPVYVPMTPSAMGMFKITQPKIVLDETYAVPSKVIIGHDGSKTAAYDDKRDLLWLEIEKRIYNKIPTRFKYKNYKDDEIRKLTNTFFNQEIGRYSLQEFIKVYKSNFLRWCNSGSANYMVNDTVVPGNWKTYNYISNLTDTGRGSWKSIYLNLYGTLSPNSTPWEMLGYTNQPDWWESEYGATTYFDSAWYTTPPLVADTEYPAYKLWYDLENGTGRVETLYRKSGILTSTLVPVDAVGALISPFDLGLVPNPSSSQEAAVATGDNWSVGDISPVEYAWMTSEVYPFALMEFLYLMRPAVFAEKYFETVNTLLVPTVKSSSKHLVDNVTLKRKKVSVSNGLGYRRWVESRLNYRGRELDTEYSEKIDNSYTKLGYRCAGFVNKSTMSAYTESMSLGSTRPSLKIPNSDFDVILYTNPVTDVITYSGLIIRKTETGYEIFGYDGQSHDFKLFTKNRFSRSKTMSVGGKEIDVPAYREDNLYDVGDYVKYNGVFYQCNTSHVSDSVIKTKFWTRLKTAPTIAGKIINLYTDLNDTPETIKYGTVLPSEEAVVNFIYGYGEYLKSIGWVFEEVDFETNTLKDWELSINEFLAWSLGDWPVGATLRLNPASEKLVYRSDFGYVRDVFEYYNDSANLLDQDGVLIGKDQVYVGRNERETYIEAVNESVVIYFARLVCKETEHAILFNNRTIFDDLIYDPILGIRQERIKLECSKTNYWYGKYEAPGYVLTSNEMLPNLDNLADSIRFYNEPSNQIDNIDYMRASIHNVGFEEKEYLETLGLSLNSQYKFYQGMIHHKGTSDVVKRLLRSSFISDEQNLEIYDEWAIKLADFGNSNRAKCIEVLTEPGQHKQSVQIVRLNYNTDITVSDSVTDNIIDINVNDSEKWITKPSLGVNENLWPLKDFKRKEIFAGPVLLTEASKTAITFAQLITKNLSYVVDDIVWVTEDYKDKWNIFKLGSCVSKVSNALTETVEFDSSISQYDDTSYDVFNDESTPSDNIYNGLFVCEGQLYQYEQLTSTEYRIYKNLEVATAEELLNLVGKDLFTFRTLKFSTKSEGVSSGENKFWVEAPGHWEVWDLNESTAYPVREVSKQVDTVLFKNLYVYDKDTSETLAMLPIVDIMSGMYPGIVNENIDFRLDSDPARYSPDDVNYFSEDQVGLVWWDTSTCKVLEYNQGDLENRRITCNKFHPDSSIDVYEWVKSTSLPEEYTDGIPKDISQYTTFEIYEEEIGIYATYYYFWVKEKSTKPTSKRKTMSVKEVAYILRNLTSTDYAWFCPIKSDKSTNSWSFVTYNLATKLNNYNCVLQMNYEMNEKNGSRHTEWYLCSEGNDKTPIKEIHWSKMVDSLCEYDAAGLSVPDPLLSDFERYGIKKRPRQTMFKNAQQARKVLARAIIKISSDDTTKLGTPVTYMRSDRIFDSYETLTYEQSLALRSYLDELKNELFVGKQSSNIGKLYFAMLNYAFSENQIIDWAFKTSFIYIKQVQNELSETSKYTVDPFESILSYINEVKPYHTKVRNYSAVHVANDSGDFDITEDVNQLTRIKYRDICGWDAEVWDVENFEYCDTAKKGVKSYFGNMPWELCDWDGSLFDGDIYTSLVSSEFNTNLDDQYVVQIIAAGSTRSFDMTTYDIKLTSDIGVLIDGKFTMSYYLLDSEIVFFNDLVPGSVIQIFELQPVDGGKFRFARDSSDDVSYFKFNEAFVMNVDNVEGDPLAPTSIISFKMFIDDSGVVSVYRNADYFSARLAEDLANTDEEIVLDNVGDGLKTDVNLDVPGVLWIAGERIEYREMYYDALTDRLTVGNLKRATKGTTIRALYASGTKVFDGTETNRVNNAERRYLWSDPGVSLIESTTDIADFLKQYPGSALS